MKFLLFASFILLIGNCQNLTSGQQTNDKESQQTSYQLAYNVAVSAEEDDYDVFIMDLDGANQKNITNHKDVAWTYLAGAEKVFFISDRDTCKRCYFLYEMDAGGNNIRKLTNFQLRDSWMGSRNNGTELIVNPHPKVDSVFYIIDLNGNILQKLPTGLVFASDPCFSPDGKQIAFRGAHKKSKREKGFVDEIYLMNADGSGLQQLSHYPPRDTTALWYSYRSGPPRWHPTENFISYQSMQNGKYSLYAVTPDGKKQWKLTGNPQDEGWHDWSPDGKWLAIEIFDTSQTQFFIGLMNWETKEMKVLTDTSYTYQQAPVFVEIQL